MQHQYCHFFARMFLESGGRVHVSLFQTERSQRPSSKLLLLDQMPISSIRKIFAFGLIVWEGNLSFVKLPDSFLYQLKDKEILTNEIRYPRICLCTIITYSILNRVRWSLFQPDSRQISVNYGAENNTELDWPLKRFKAKKVNLFVT